MKPALGLRFQIYLPFLLTAFVCYPLLWLDPPHRLGPMPWELTWLLNFLPIVMLLMVIAVDRYTKQLEDRLTALESQVEKQTQ